MGLINYSLNIIGLAAVIMLSEPIQAEPVLPLGAKENCPDTRNSKIIKLIKMLKIKYNVDVYDPIANTSKIKLISNLKNNFYDAIVLCVNHDIFKLFGYKNLNKLLKKNRIIFDIKNILGNEKNIIKL